MVSALRFHLNLLFGVCVYELVVFFQPPLYRYTAGAGDDADFVLLLDGL